MTTHKPKKRANCNRESGCVQRMDIPLKERIEAARRRLVEKWNADAGKLLTDAGVPEWVEVGGMPGNSLPHRLEWFLLRRKDVSAAERSGVLPDMNAMMKGYIDQAQRPAE